MVDVIVWQDKATTIKDLNKSTDAVVGAPATVIKGLPIIVPDEGTTAWASGAWASGAWADDSWFGMGS